MTLDTVRIPPPEERVRRRLAMGLSQRDLAALAGADPGAVARWETGVRELGSEASVRYLEMILGRRIDPPGRACRACGAAVTSPSFRICERCYETRCHLCRLPVSAHHVGCPARPPRRCEHCSSTENLSPGFRYCATCNAQRCNNCQRIGAHHPDCYRAVTRTCTACEAAPRTSGVLCAECHDRNLCDICGRRWTSRPHQHRPPRVRAAFVGAVTAAELEQVYVETWHVAVRRAAWMVGKASAQDVVQNAAVGLLRRRDHLRPPATSGLFMRRVVWEALVFKRPGKITLVNVDPLDLAGLELQQWRLEHGARAEAR